MAFPAGPGDSTRPRAPAVDCAAPGITSSSYTVSLPAYGFSVPGVN
jgi:hypothetical protein